MSQANEVVLNLPVYLLRQDEGNTWCLVFPFYPQTLKPGVGNFDRLQKVGMKQIIVPSLTDSSYGGFKLTELHFHSGPRSGLAGLIWDGFLEAHAPVGDVQLEPSGGLVLVLARDKAYFI